MAIHPTRRRSSWRYYWPILWLAGATASAQISPGPLSKAHASLDGPLHCAECHTLGGGFKELKCLDCHTEIARRVRGHLGFHGSVLAPNSTSGNCVACHSEHNGRDFALVHWQPSQQAFDHRQTGYALEGKHAALTCQQCHNSKNIANRAEIKVKDLNQTFLGLSRDCQSCHHDVHEGRLGSNCAKCHNTSDWKAAQSGFDHSQTRFPLTGLHTQVACAKCHKPEASNPAAMRFAGLAFGKCSDCHSDPHHGEFKASCESCHSTRGWKLVSTASAGASFDHSKTAFPLLGKHAGVACSACHAGGAFQKPVAHARCLDCHRDAHQGQFLARQDRGECSACHTVEGWKPATFGVKEHASTGYPLLGRHESVACAKCHIPAGPQTIFRVKFARCFDCHRDAHQGQFAGPPMNNRCEACHTVNGFKPSGFTLAQHSKTRFPLTGGHLAVPCVECHRARDDAPPGASAPYHFKTLACTECHADPHRGQFAARMAKLDAGGKPVGCEACHVNTTWRDIKRFDHSTAAFALTGTHRAVACVDCHKPPNLEVTMKNVAFTSAPARCEGCHEDPHAGQFARDGKNPGCADCHNTIKWRPSLFDHDRRTVFALQGAHQNVACGDCHKTTRAVGEKTVLFYRPTPTQCAACHGPLEPKPPARRPS
jgi:Cytochrome c7 and related cytochrome c